MANTRNIPLELAQVQRDRGQSLTRDEFRRLGYTDAQLSEANILRAGEIYSELTKEAA